MAEISISFNGEIYRLDESVLSDATAELKYHLSNVMNGTGAIINIDGTSFNIDSTKLSTATNDLVAHLGAVAGNGTTIVVGGVEHSVSSAKLSDSIVELNTVLGDLQSNSSFTITYYDSDGTTVLKTENLAYGAMPSYAPTKDGYMFGGWSPELSVVTGDASYVSSWEENLTFATASWTRIAEISESGRASEYFRVGETRNITFNNNGETYDVAFKIAGFNHDTTEDGGTAGITLVSNYVLSGSTVGQTSEHNIKKYTGWSGSALRTTLNSTTLGFLPDDLVPHIKSVQKISSAAGSPGKLETTTDKLWIPSITEYGLAQSWTAPNQGTQYASPPSRSFGAMLQTQGTLGTTGYQEIVTRSNTNYSSSMVTIVNGNGTASYSGSEGLNQYHLGFCI